MEEDKIIKIQCPNCKIELWIDMINKNVIKLEKNSLSKKKKSLEHLLFKEKERSKEFNRKFEATFELQKIKKKEIEKKFRKAVSKADDEEIE
jgi:hypothetical protein